MSKRIALFPVLLLVLLVIAAAALTWMNFSQALPRSQWRRLPGRRISMSLNR